MAKLREELSRFLMRYKFGIDEVLTKITILQEEFLHLHEHNPIEHVNSRLKSPESIIGKIERKSLDPSFDSIRRSITDIAGVRITCSFIADAYRVFDLLTQQSDIRVLEVKDYIKDPKPNGYRSLHAIIEIPVFMSDGVVPVTVELQIRTIAMDFWASLEHKIYYKYDGQVPSALLGNLTETADIAANLDLRMERLHHEVLALNSDPSGQETRDRPGDPKLKGIGSSVPG
ncbi:GTP pyrophosphokinase family protein [Leifsonia kafniensis]